jgi:type II secretory pathway component PulF
MDISEKRLRQAGFWKKFLRLTRGRVAVLRALEVIIAEETDADFRQTLESINKRISSGSELSEALAATPAEFSLSVTELIRTAEKTGAWDEILEEIAAGLGEGTFD